MESSYRENFYDLFFESLMYIHVPRLVVECGILDGFSLDAIRGASHKDCKVIGIDLFEDYEFKHRNYEQIKHKFDPYKNVEIRKQNALEAYKDFEDKSIDILHIDISNDGDKLSRMFDVWDQKVKNGGLIIFEGGSEERDKIEWMVKYNKTPISELKNTLHDRNYEFVTLSPNPSITICRKVLINK